MTTDVLIDAKLSEVTKLKVKQEGQLTFISHSVIIFKYEHMLQSLKKAKHQNSLLFLIWYQV